MVEGEKTEKESHRALAETERSFKCMQKCSPSETK